MTHRYAPTSSAPKLRVLPFAGLRSAFADGYGPSSRWASSGWAGSSSSSRTR